MEINRNQYFFVGLLLVFLGLEFRMVKTFVLNEKATRALAERAGGNDAASRGFGQYLAMSSAPTSRKALTPPDWVGWLLVSVGAVLILHSLAMQKPNAPATG